jgi:pimeloyl-ACP methyl ester carboxylesterase
MIHHTAFSADGTALSYCISGLPPSDDTPAIVCANGFLTSDFYWEVPRARLSRRATFLTWDYKGHGLSGPAQTPDGTAVHALVDDLYRVLDHAGIRRPILVGFSMGCQVIFEAWRVHPERVAALIPLFGPHGYMFDHALHPLLGRLFKALLNLDDRLFSLLLSVGGVAMNAPFSFEVGKALKLIGAATSRAQMDQFNQHFLNVHGPTVRAIGQAISTHTAEPYLPQVSAPTCIIAGDRDTFCPVHLVRSTHDLLPNSELVLMPGLNHTALFEAPDEITDALTDFLERRGLLPA